MLPVDTGVDRAVAGEASVKLRFAVCMAMGAARLIELACSHRNISGAGENREGEGSRKTYPLMVALHTTVIVVTALAGGHVRWRWLLILLAVQPLRVWVIATLGRNWNTRGAVSDTIEVRTGAVLLRAAPELRCCGDRTSCVAIGVRDARNGTGSDRCECPAIGHSHTGRRDAVERSSGLQGAFRTEGAVHSGDFLSVRCRPAGRRGREGAVRSAAPPPC